MNVIGWDIGGVNTKAVHVRDGQVVAAVTRAFEVQRAPHDLAGLLRDIARTFVDEAPAIHAVTMTAELSQAFATKRDGVRHVVDAVTTAFRESQILFYGTDGKFHPADAAREAPLLVAAANWAATAAAIAAEVTEALVIDTGTTTTDVIPIVQGRVSAIGRTDPERLASGELVYTGAVRTPVEAIVTHVPFGDQLARVSAEAFALSGDVHVWRGDLEPGEYSAPTPDRRPATREYAGARLARVICADREMVDDCGISAIADAVAEAQIAQISDGVAQVRRRHPELRCAIVTGAGAFLARAAALQAGLDVVSLPARFAASEAQCTPAASVALLFATQYGAVDLVIKIGGGVLDDPASFAAALALVTESARAQRVLVVPGGGPFADAVRDVDRRLQLGHEEAHWMAILGMDQYAHLLAARIEGAELVRTKDDAVSACARRRVAVLAPYRWLRDTDPLPHSWKVTSDSIAAWIAEQVGTRRLILIKPADATEPLVDAWFARTLSPAVSVEMIRATPASSSMPATR